MWHELYKPNQTRSEYSINHGYSKRFIICRAISNPSLLPFFQVFHLLQPENIRSVFSQALNPENRSLNIMKY